MKLIKDIFYTKDNDPMRSLDIYLPDKESFPVFVYFHGGGIEGGDKKSGEKIWTKLAEDGICVVNANYRLYPEAVYPEFIRDAAGAVGWTFKHIKEYGDATDIFVGGTSAGGYLSMMLCFDDKYLAVHKIKPTDIKGFFHDAGQPSTHYNVLRERGVDSKRIIVDEAAPLYHISEKEYTNMVFIFSDNDLKNRYEQTMLLKGALEAFKIPKEKYEFILMRNSTHCSYCKKETPEGENFLGVMIEKFINRIQNKV